jgi:hypothetical protein
MSPPTPPPVASSAWLLVTDINRRLSAGYTEQLRELERKNDIKITQT